MHMIKLDMKKLAPFVTASTFLAAAGKVFAQTTNPQIRISPPPQGYTDIGDFITQGLRLAFIIAVVVVLVMLVWGAIQWIFSGGEKEAVASARGRIINALIGFAILAVAFAIAQVAAQFLGFPSITDFQIPGPTRTP